MRKYFFCLILAGSFCLSISLDVKATVYTHANVGYEPEIGAVRAFVGTQADYDTTLYYCSEAYGYVFQDGVEIGGLYVYDEGGGGYQACVGRAMTETYFPYDPNAEYDIESFHEVDVIFHQVYLEYYDYYNYIEYTYGEQIMFPSNYSFVGLGPPQVSGVRDILLGVITGAFTAGAVAGQPHHLKLVSDNITTASCGSVRRLMKFRVVDSTGRRTGRVKVVETIQDHRYPSIRYPNIYNGCQGSYYTPSRCREVDRDNTFTDQLWVGCPSAGDPCGFMLFRSQWWWCPRGTPQVSLTANVYDVTHGRVAVNGNTAPYSAGTDFY